MKRRLTALLLASTLFWVADYARSDDWRTSRGDAASTGFADTKLPSHPEVIWEFTSSKSGFEGTPIIAGDRVFVGDVDGGFYALDLKTGTPIWEKKFKNGFVVAAAYREGRVIAGDYDGHLYCFDEANGEVVWEADLNQAIAAGPNFFGEDVLVTSEGGQLFALDRKNGKPRWDYSTGDQLRSAPTIWNDIALLGGCDARLHKIDLNKAEAIGDGLELNGPTGSTPSIRNDIAIVPTQSGQVLAFDMKKGELKWTFNDPEKSQEVRSSPAVASYVSKSGDAMEVAIVTTRNRRVLALDVANGEVVWESIVRKRCDSSPVICDGRVWVGAIDGMLYSFNLESGSEEWTYQLAGQLIASPAIASNRIVVATDKGKVVCFGVKSDGK